MSETDTPTYCFPHFVCDVNNNCSALKQRIDCKVNYMSLVLV